jgi:mRNA interferase MazF
VQKTHDPLTGEIWDVNFSPQVGREQAGIRPALVLSNDRFNAMPHGLRIVIPLTGNDRDLPHHVMLTPPQGGITKSSFIMCEQVKSQSLQRFIRRRGMVDESTLLQVLQVVDLLLEAQ